MNERIKKLRTQTLEAKPTISAERARLITEFYKRPETRGLSTPMQHALAFKHIMENKSHRLQRRRAHRRRARAGAQGDADLSRGLHPLPPGPRVSSTTARRPPSASDEETRRVYAEEIIPFWQGRSQRDRIFAEMTQEWIDAYEAGIFTEFMEQRAPGHTVLDDKIYRKGMLDFKEDIDAALAGLDFMTDPAAYDKQEELKAMAVSCRRPDRLRPRGTPRRPASWRPARRTPPGKPSSSGSPRSATASRPTRPAISGKPSRSTGSSTSASSPSTTPGTPSTPAGSTSTSGPSTRRAWPTASLTKETARELLQAFWIKFNNQPAPPKVGVTAEESGTYTDFALINVGGLQGRRHRRRQRPVASSSSTSSRRCASSSRARWSRSAPRGPTRFLAARPQDRQDRLRPALDLQHRRHRPGARPSGQVPSSTPATAAPAAASRPAPSARRPTS